MLRAILEKVCTPRARIVAHNTDVSFSLRAAPLNPNAQDVTVSIVELFRSKEGNGKVAFNSIKHVLVEKA